MMQNKPLTMCAECGEQLYDGDTVYSLLGRTYCCACVRAALTVCRAEPIDYRRILMKKKDGKRGGTDDCRR